VKIVTVNIIKEDIAKIKRLIGETSLYPSRSEFFRVAIRNFIVRELNLLYQEAIPEPEPEPQPTPPSEDALREMCKIAKANYLQKLLQNSGGHLL